MPVVPDFATPDVLPRGAIQPVSPQAGLQGDNALQSAGAKIEAGGQRLFQANMQVAQQQQQTAGLDANNKTQQKVQNIASNVMTLQGKNAMDALPGAISQINEIQQQGGASLSPYAKAIYDRTSSYMTNAVLRQVHDHVNQQAVVFQKQTLLGTANLAVQTSALNYGDDQAVQTGVQTAADAASKMADIDGLAGPAKTNMVLQATSSAWKQVITAAAQHHPRVAALRLQEAMASGGLAGPDAITMQHLVNTARMPQVANEVAAGITGQGNTAHGFTDTIMHLESGGRQFEPDGVTPLVSDKGAIGMMQVEPATGEEIAKANGIPWDPNRLATDPAYNQKIGTLVIASLKTQFNGDPAKVLAGYNAGPAAVTAAVAKYGEGGWLAHMPAETQAYVTKGTALMGGTLNAPRPTPENLETNLQANMDRAGAAMAARFPGDPNAYDRGASAVFEQTNRIANALRDQQKAQFGTVMNAVVSTKVSNPQDLFKQGGPAVISAYNALPPTLQASINAAMAKNLPGADTKLSAQGITLFNGLKGLAMTNPEAASEINPMSPTILKVLTLGQAQQFADIQAKLKQRALAGIPASQVHSFLESAAPSLISAGLNPHANPATHPKAYAAYQSFVGQVQPALDAFWEQHNRAPTLKEGQAMINGLLTQGTVVGTGTLLAGSGLPWTGRDTEPLYEAEAKSDVAHFDPVVPPDANAAINAAYRQAHGGQYPDTAQVKAIYMMNLTDAARGHISHADAIKALGGEPMPPPPAMKLPVDPNILASAGGP